MAFEKLDMYLDRGDLKWDWLNTNDGQPGCNKEGARKAAERYNCDVILVRARDKKIVFRATPDPDRGYGVYGG